MFNQKGMKRKPEVDLLNHLEDHLIPESGDKNTKKRRKVFRDENAPKPPKNAYMFYFHEHKEDFKNDAEVNPKDVVSRIAASWRALSEEEKKHYVELASAGRLKYEEEVKQYRNSDAYKHFLIEKERFKQMESESQETPCSSTKKQNYEMPAGNNKLLGVPIFSPQFLELNKNRETTLRKLRREVSELEEETELIQKNIYSLSNRLEIMQEAIYNDEFGLMNVQQTIEKWRKLTLKALDDGNFMTELGLSPSSTAEELISTLEAVSKNEEETKNVNVALRHCLSNVSYA